MKPYWLFAAPVLTLLASCGGEPTHRASEPQAAPVAVRAAAAESLEWPETYAATGTVRARTAATVASKMTGYVETVHVRLGDRVRAAQPLIRMEALDMEAVLRRAEAARAEVAGAIPEMDNGVASAKAALDLAQATFDRIADLAAKKSVSSQELDEASAKLKLARAGYEMARARRTQLDARLAQADEETGRARIARGYAVLSAPFDGVVTAKNVEPGNLATPGAPLLTIEREGAYRLEAAVDESRLPGARVGQPVEVTLDGVGRSVMARVSEVAPSVDAASRSYIVKIDLPSSPELRSGMFGRALFSLGRRKLLAVPASALVEQGQLQSVFVVEDGAAHIRMVTAGERRGDAVEMLSGVHEGERIVAPPPAGLRDGARVEVRP
jgi:RND family efflux transporter MFP subunit